MTNQENPDNLNSQPSDSPDKPHSFWRQHELKFIFLIGASVVSSVVYTGMNHFNQPETSSANNKENRLRLSALESIQAGPDRADDIIGRALVPADTAAYTAISSAIRQAALTEEVPPRTTVEDRLSFHVGIEASTIYLNTTHKSRTITYSVTLFYKDIDGNGTNEILATPTDPANFSFMLRDE